MNLATTISIFAGGAGSGCHGSNCGRPITSKTFRQMRDKLKSLGVPIKRGTSPWDIVKTYDAWFRSAKVREQQKKSAKRLTERARLRIKKAIKQGKIPKRISKKEQRIDLQPVWKGRVKNQYQSHGYQITELKTPKQYEKNKGTWVNKPSYFKGKFLVDLAEQRTHLDPKERNSFWIHQASPEQGVSVEVHRNMGSLQTKVIERRLGQYGAIVDHREVSFKNMGRAAGFLNKRYGITFKLKGK